MTGVLNESAWEQWILDQLARVEWEYRTGKEVAPGSGERESWHDIVLRGSA